MLAVLLLTKLTQKNTMNTLSLHILSVLFKIPIGVRYNAWDDPNVHGTSWQWRLLIWIASREKYTIDDLLNEATVWRWWYSYSVVDQIMAVKPWWLSFVPFRGRQRHIPLVIPDRRDDRPRWIG